MTNRIGKSSKPDIKEGNVPPRCSLLFADKKKRKGAQVTRHYLPFVNEISRFHLRLKSSSWTKTRSFIDNYLLMRRDIICVFYVYMNNIVNLQLNDPLLSRTSSQ